MHQSNCSSVESEAYINCSQSAAAPRATSSEWSRRSPLAARFPLYSEQGLSQQHFSPERNVLVFSP